MAIDKSQKEKETVCKKAYEEFSSKHPNDRSPRNGKERNVASNHQQEHME